MHDLKCEDVLIRDVRGLSRVTNYVVIASGTSNRQMYSVGENLADLAKSMDQPVFRRNHERSNEWVVIDCVDVIFHLFEPNMRAFYDLESLWVEAPNIPWQRDGSTTTPKHQT